ncbi:MAG: hypothetical protein MUF18_08160 [Fimbriiglobus sp.]|nr:hypothetical protein [Fimbriiglobus sp.]
MSPQTIDVTGLPEAVVAHLRALVDSIRGDAPPVPRWDAPLTTEQLAERERIRLAVMDAARPPAPPLTPEEWIAAQREFIAKHAVHGVVVDDSRESFYEGRE